MSDLADYLESALIDWVFGATQLDTPPGTVYVALHTSAPSDDGTTGELSTTDTGYSRTGVAASDWTQPSSNQAENTVAVSFGPASSDWGDITHFSVWDAQSGGNCLWVGGLNTTRTVIDGDEAKFSAGELTFEVN